jgi:LysR family transcriptional regulator of abg operon
MREAHLRDFIAVADSGSLRGAARYLKLTQGAVSKNLLALEREFGVPLLIRSTHGVELTEFGRILLRRARLADVELRKAKDEIAELTGHHHGIVSIGMSSTGEALLAAPAIQRFREAQPGAVVNMRGGTAATLVSLLREGRLDFAVSPVSRTVLGSDLRAERLLSSDFVAVVREGHPCAGATELSELQDCEWIHGTRPGELDPVILGAFRKAQLPPPSFAVQRDSFSALIFLLLQSDYVALASIPASAPFCRPGLLTRVPLNANLGVSVQSLLTPATRPLTPQAQLLASEIRRAARGQRR